MQCNRVHLMQLSSIYNAICIYDDMVAIFITIANAARVAEDGRLLALLLRRRRRSLKCSERRPLVDELVLAIGCRLTVAVVRLVDGDVAALGRETEAITADTHPRALLRYFGQRGEDYRSRVGAP